MSLITSVSHAHCTGSVNFRDLQTVQFVTSKVHSLYTLYGLYTLSTEHLGMAHYKNKILESIK